MDVGFLAEFYAGLAQDSSLSLISFIWHGGEPLTLGIPFLRKLYFLQQQILPPAIQVRNSLQTNGCLVNGEWAEHLATYNFSVGVSLDGPRAVHDKKRRAADGSCTVDRCLNGIAALRKYDVGLGVLTVVSEDLLRFGARRLLDFFESQEIPNYALLSLRANWSSPADALAYNRAFAKFMERAAKLWFARDNPEVRIRELESKLDRFFGLPSRICTDAGACVGSYFGVEADGTVWHCDKFLTDPRFYLGNVHDDSFAAIRNSNRLADLKQHEVKVRQRCASCKWFHLCGGGCLRDAIYFASVGGRPGTRDCASFAIFESLSHLIAESPPILAALHSHSSSDVPSF
jgi:uncharacterized protein